MVAYPFSFASVTKLSRYAFIFGNFSKYLSRLFCFYSVSFGYAGIILSLWFLLKPKGVLINNGAVYIDISPYVLLLSFCIGYFILLLLRKHFGTDIEAGNILKMTVFYQLRAAQNLPLSALTPMTLPFFLVTITELRRVTPLFFAVYKTSFRARFIIRADVTYLLNAVALPTTPNAKPLLLLKKPT